MDRRLEHLRCFKDALRLPASSAAAAPEHLALRIAGLAHPNLDIEASLDVINNLALLTAFRMSDISPGEGYARTLLDVFRTELGFSGALEQYNAADNSLLDVVLERRTGLPIMLSLVMVTIGQRIGIGHDRDGGIDGIGLPGHFMVRYRSGAPGDPGQWLIDPFNGEVITPESAPAYLGALFGQEVAIPAEMYKPFTPAAWARRILNNLRSAYHSAEDHAMGARVIGYMLALEPAMPALWRERAVLHHNADDPEAAIVDLRRYFFLSGQYSLVWGDDAARSQLLPLLSAQDKELFTLYQRDLAATARFN